MKVTGGPWPERIGLECELVDTTGCGTYPVYGLGEDEVVIFIEDDPLNGKSGHRLPNRRLWTCAISRRHLGFDHDGPNHLDQVTV